MFMKNMYRTSTATVRKPSLSVENKHTNTQLHYYTVTQKTGTNIHFSDMQ